MCSQVDMSTDSFLKQTGLQLLKTMSKGATGPFGATALLKEFALATEEADVICLH